jgi:hypothetical protein
MKRPIDIDLNKLREFVHYDPNTGIFTLKKSKKGNVAVGTILGSRKPNGYMRIRIFNKQYYSHRVAWYYVYGESDFPELDHINTIKDDNRISNLRIVTRSENCQNREYKSKSGFRGVSLIDGRWLASIWESGKRIHLGTFQDRDSATEAWIVAAKNIGHIKVKEFSNVTH